MTKGIYCAECAKVFTDDLTMTLHKEAKPNHHVEYFDTDSNSVDYPKPKEQTKEQTKQRKPRDLISAIRNDMGNIGFKIFNKRSFMNSPKILLLVVNLLAISTIANYFYGNTVELYSNISLYTSIFVIVMELLEYEGKRRMKQENA